MLVAVLKRAGEEIFELLRTLRAVLLPPCCLYIPSCSEYAKQAFARHGALKGAWLSAGRLLRCHPFHEGGLDPVPH